MSKKAQAKTPEREIKALYKDIEAEFSQWNFLKEHGGSDPFYADGVNMNLVRNHIIYDYRKLDELEQVPVQLDLFGGAQSMANRRPIPPEVPGGYMARKEWILRTAKRLMKRFEQSDDPGERRDLERLRSGLKTMDYVQMRRVVRWYESRKQKEA